VIIARHTSECADCGNRIEVGDPIRCYGPRNSVHHVCPEAVGTGYADDGRPVCIVCGDPIDAETAVKNNRRCDVHYQLWEAGVFGEAR
jgi:hypothetical protein